MSTTTQLRLTAAMPSLTVNDVGASLAFYCDRLGFLVEQRFELQGKLMGASIQAGAVTFLLSQDDGAKGTDRVKGTGFRIYCSTTQDVDELARALRRRGVELSQEPTDQPWGARDFAVVDPDGFKVSISTGVG